MNKHLSSLISGFFGPWSSFDAVSYHHYYYYQRGFKLNELSCLAKFSYRIAIWWCKRRAEKREQEKEEEEEEKMNPI